MLAQGLELTLRLPAEVDWTQGDAHGWEDLV